MHAYQVGAAQHFAPNTLLNNPFPLRGEGRVRNKVSLRCLRIHPLPQGRGSLKPFSLWAKGLDEGKAALGFRFGKQRGTALIFALVMLLLLTLLGITAISTSTLQEKMAGNMRDQYTAQQASDSILRDGEALVYDQPSRPTPACPPPSAVTGRVWDSSIASVGNPLCLTDLATATDSWWSSNGFLSAVANNNISQQPRYVVEWIQRVEEPLGQSPKKFRYYYQTTGWSVGFTDSARALLQSVFSKKTDDYSTP